MFKFAEIVAKQSVADTKTCTHHEDNGIVSYLYKDRAFVC